MAKSAVIQTRIDPVIKNKAQSLLSKIGDRKL
jgi:antitoxin component of RelBE/YafQ-DinJ toxin-antitoxin module